ncbi:PKD domain-containing protein [Ferruginibacter sp. SUN106]|uniref:PKD domain-containing protein n=1 Tax=Ferruginibacter sp. SUN106 TaxID=2978348 RepID=UPI003D36E1D5
MKKILLACFFTLSILSAFATHIAGGEMIYVYLGPGTAPGTSSYKITLKLFRDELTGGAAMPPSVFIGIFDNGTNAQYPGPGQAFTVFLVNGPVGTPVPVDPAPPCMNNPPPISYNVGFYDLIVDLPDNLNGYTACYQTCCRSNPLINVFNPAAGQGEGSSYVCNIPGTAQLPVGHNSSPQFVTQLGPVCHGSPFTLNFHANDPDGDSLVYSFCNAFDRGVSINAGNVNPNPPPYQSVTYINGFSGTNPLGSLAILNTQTGIISGKAPPLSGKYVVCVCISEYRNGVLISNHRKDFMLNVSDCDIPTANPNPGFTTCDGFTVNFFHNSSGANDVFWDFGDPSTLADTSILNSPSYTYPDTGVYIVRFIINRGQPCTDTAYRTIRVYPGFLPGFITSPALCVNQPIQFTDTSYTAYGAIDSWRWDFGDPPPIFSDTSHLKTTTYTYAQAGTYTVELKVTNSKGCEKTMTKNIIVSDLPIVDVFPADTIYCGLDSIQLTGTGTGSFNWLPNTNIIGANTATPIVFPTTATKYYATLTNLAGCSSKDSVTVTPKFDLTNAFTGPSPICEEDTVTLTGTSNYAPNVSWQWSPAATVESPTNGTTRVYPTVTTNYILATTWGKHCVATASKLITVKPLAVANAGPSPVICTGQQSTQLTASGGNTYSWSPVTGLSNPNIANPIASPGVTTIYTVAVGVTGCPKTRSDSLIVTVQPSPPLTLLNDTLICNTDTLQLTTTGTGNYTWSPNYMISSTTVPSPLVSPDVPTRYFVRLTDAFGCHSDDTVFVDVKDHVTLFAGNDTTICQTDGFLLATQSDALHYKWTPSTYLDFDTLKHPFTKPLNTITYHLVANIGKCQSQDDITIKVVPYPAANAGPDASVCPGFSAQLIATGGSSYLWTPATFLDNRNIANPRSVNPTASIRYIVAVTDTLGCPKPVKDTVWVNVYSKVIANAGPKDTSVVLGEPLALNATGGVTYLWNPITWLNNPAIRNPVSLPQSDILYVVTATSAGGCIGTDSILVHVFKVDPDMYVPTAFTPNGDGNNDILKPILLGMKELRYFRVYNRFGNLVYSTTEIGKGWDGIYGGKGQDPATFVWMAEGVTYKGEVKKKKGYAVLIRQ